VRGEPGRLGETGPVDERPLQPVIQAIERIIQTWRMKNSYGARPTDRAAVRAFGKISGWLAITTYGHVQTAGPKGELRGFD
jgi:hypothetical protein